MIAESVSVQIGRLRNRDDSSVLFRQIQSIVFFPRPARGY